MKLLLDAFSDGARDAFGFLPTFGFACASSTTTCVRFESDRVYVEVKLGVRDGEASINFGRLGQDQGFSFRLFLKLVNPARDRQLGECLVENIVQLRVVLAQLAMALREDGRPILFADEQLFRKMDTVRWWDFQPEALK
jgi:hypothetical protein